MSRAEGQKAKLLVLLKILQRYTDEDHWISVPRIVELLAAEGIPAERKSIYADIETLQQQGYDIALQRGRNGGYWLVKRTFELPELKLLVDAVQASRFITAPKSKKLITTLTQFASMYEEGDLKRQVYASGRIKASNESIYYNVDALYRGIQENRQIEFTYLEWTLEKKRRPRREGGKYIVSPWAMLWEDENYYLVAYQEGNGLRHYRVDKMASINLLAAGRLGGDEYNPQTMREYAKPMFGMFSGTKQKVTFSCDETMIGPMLDRFGTEVTVIPQPDKTFTLYADVAVSPPFFGWVCGFGGKVRILEPETVKEDFVTHLRTLLQKQGE